MLTPSCRSTNFLEGPQNLATPATVPEPPFHAQVRSGTFSQTGPNMSIPVLADFLAVPLPESLHALFKASWVFIAAILVHAVSLFDSMRRP